MAKNMVSTRRSLLSSCVVGGRQSDVSLDSCKVSHKVLDEPELAVFRTVLCEAHQSSSCVHADSCPHSHCLTWQRRNPYQIRYSSELCPDIQFLRRAKKMSLVRKCNRGKSCCFAHSKEEELYHPLMYKTKMCSTYPNCKRYYCPFAHTLEELRHPMSLPVIRFIWGELSRVANPPDSAPRTPASVASLAGGVQSCITESQDVREGISENLGNMNPFSSKVSYSGEFFSESVAESYLLEYERVLGITDVCSYDNSTSISDHRGCGDDHSVWAYCNASNPMTFRSMDLYSKNEEQFSPNALINGIASPSYPAMTDIIDTRSHMNCVQGSMPGRFNSGDSVLSSCPIPNTEAVLNSYGVNMHSRYPCNSELYSGKSHDQVDRIRCSLTSPTMQSNSYLGDVSLCSSFSNVSSLSIPREDDLRSIATKSTGVEASVTSALRDKSRQQKSEEPPLTKADINSIVSLSISLIRLLNGGKSQSSQAIAPPSHLNEIVHPDQKGSYSLGVPDRENFEGQSMTIDPCITAANFSPGDSPNLSSPSQLAYSSAYFDKPKANERNQSHLFDFRNERVSLTKSASHQEPEDSLSNVNALLNRSQKEISMLPLRRGSFVYGNDDNVMRVASGAGSPSYCSMLANYPNLYKGEDSYSLSAGGNNESTVSTTFDDARDSVVEKSEDYFSDLFCPNTGLADQLKFLDDSSNKREDRLLQYPLDSIVRNDENMLRYYDNSTMNAANIASASLAQPIPQTSIDKEPFAVGFGDLLMEGGSSSNGAFDKTKARLDLLDSWENNLRQLEDIESENILLSRRVLRSGGTTIAMPIVTASNTSVSASPITANAVNSAALLQEACAGTRETDKLSLISRSHPSGMKEPSSRLERRNFSEDMQMHIASLETAQDAFSMNAIKGNDSNRKDSSHIFGNISTGGYAPGIYPRPYEADLINFYGEASLNDMLCLRPKSDGASVTPSTNSCNSIQRLHGSIPPPPPPRLPRADKYSNFNGTACESSSMLRSMAGIFQNLCLQTGCNQVNKMPAHLLAYEDSYSGLYSPDTYCQVYDRCASPSIRPMYNPEAVHGKERIKHYGSKDSNSSGSTIARADGNDCFLRKPDINGGVSLDCHTERLLNCTTNGSSLSCTPLSSPGSSMLSDFSDSHYKLLLDVANPLNNENNADCFEKYEKIWNEMAMNSTIM